jgi:tetratricopeptide (TPR) repeat protein
MRRLPKLTAAVLAVSMMLLGTGCSYLRARDQLNKGIANYRAAKFSLAVENFKTAMELDPAWETPQVYLATAYISQWIPGAESPENIDFANKAKAEFLKVLEKNPQEDTALGYMAMLAYSQATTGLGTSEERLAKLDEAADWHKKRIAAAPNKDAYYNLAVINYQKWSPVWLSTRASLKMRSDEPGPFKDPKLRAEMKEKYATIVDDAIGYLEKALELNPEYVDAMTYKGILIRQRADLLDNSDEYKAAIVAADEWQDKSMNTRKMIAERAAKKAGGGIHTE